MRLINADELLHNLELEAYHVRDQITGYLIERGMTLTRLRQIIDEAPTIDPHDRVLEIIKEKWTECDFRYGEVNEIRAAMNTAKDIYSAVEALKGGDRWAI